MAVARSSAKGTDFRDEHPEEVEQVLSQMESEGIKKTHRKVWETALGSSGTDELSLLSIGSMEEANEIIDKFFVADKINPVSFWGNLIALFRDSLPILQRIDFGLKQSDETTKSISQFTAVLDRPSFAPSWFIAAYPDVLVWHRDQLREYRTTNRCDEGGLAELNAKLFGLDLSDPALDQKPNDFVDNEGKARPNILRNLVQSYKDRISRKLETAVKTPEDDVYLGSEILEECGVESNFILIAVNTTKYYSELVRNHSDRFKNEVSLLAAAGVLDATYYVMDQTVRPSEILEMAEEATISLQAEGALLDFIVRLEVKLFTVDTPGLDVSEIETACLAQKINIADAIERVRNEYTSEPMFASAVYNFMHSNQYRELRHVLGIED